MTERNLARVMVIAVLILFVGMVLTMAPMPFQLVGIVLAVLGGIPLAALFLLILGALGVEVVKLFR